MDDKQNIINFYLTKEDGKQKNIIEKWNNQMDVGKSIVPSIYIKEYQELIINYLLKYTQKNSYILSIGSGCGNIESQLQRLGYTNITCLDLIKEFTQITKDKGLNSITGDAFELDTLNIGTQDLIYLDGSLGHLSSSYTENFDNSYIQILSIIKKSLHSQGYIIFSDDEPYLNLNYQLHPKTNHLRISLKNFTKQLEDSGFSIIHTETFFYNRPIVGTVSRRIVIVNIK